MTSGPLLSPREPMRPPPPNGGVIQLPFVDHRGEDREVVGAVDIDETVERAAEFDRPRPGMLFEHFEGKVVIRIAIYKGNT